MANAVALQGRLTARRDQLQHEKPIDLPVPGYGDILVARYHALPYDLQFKIENRQDKNPNEAQKLLFILCDKLINACDGLYVQNDESGLDPIEHDGQIYKWDVRTAKDLFDIDLPENATARMALLAIFPDTMTMRLIDHAKAYTEAAGGQNAEIDKTIQGESEAGLAAV